MEAVKAKRILFVATVVKQHIMEFHLPFLKMLKESGWETAVAAKNDYNDRTKCSIPYCDTFYDLSFERNPLKAGNIKAYRELKKIIDEGAFNIVHCHTPVAAALTRLAAKDARKRGTRVFYTAHGFHFYKGAGALNWLLYYPVEKALSQKTDVLITINKEDYRRAREKLHAKMTAFVPGVGIDSKAFRPDINIRDKVRKELSIDQNTILLLSVGELNKNKNHIAVIHALGRIAKNGKAPDFRYLIAGQGRLKEKIENAARKEGISDRLILPGYRDDVNELLQAADIFVFPSKREGLPVSVMEAMASGLLCIASKIRGNTDLLGGLSSNALFELKDRDGLYNALFDMMKKGQPRSVENIEAAKKYDVEIIKQSMKTLYFV